MTVRDQINALRELAYAILWEDRSQNALNMFAGIREWEDEVYAGLIEDFNDAATEASNALRECWALDLDSTEIYFVLWLK